VGEGETGDPAIDAALKDLADAPADDLDAQIAAGQRVHQTLQGRLSDLGGA
jgi:DNA polymerase-3 subunit gamma/tau